MTMDQINSRLEELKDEKTKIKGLETEVYARIVGYYRSVRNWNKGKKEEYGHRRNFAETIVERPSVAKAVSVSPAPLSVVPEQNLELGFRVEQSVASYLYFFRKTCPNCPPVAAWLEGSGLDGRSIDVDRESGMHEATRYDVTAAPTVILLDSNGNEIGRSNTVASLESQAGVTAAAGA